MPGFVITLAHAVMCSHGGQAKPIPPAARVFVMGIPVVTLGHTYVVAGCSLPASSLPPCVTGTFPMGATRVMASYSPGTLFPLLLAPSTGLCQPTAQPLLALPAGQARVFAT
jgi:hypothetical protein